MTIEKNQNAESLDRASSEQAKSLEQKQALQQQIQQLRSLNMQIEAQKQEENAENPDTFEQDVLAQLDDLQNRVDALDLQNTERFHSEVQKIEAQLDNIKKTREELASFQKSFVKTDSVLLQQAVQAQLPDHDPKANQGRANAIKNILNIAPKEWENRVANLAARRIQKLTA